jgi:hypothetical protein
LSTEVVPEVVGDGGDGGDESGSSKKWWPLCRVAV